MICGCECPVAIFPFKGGESILNVMHFAETPLHVSSLYFFIQTGKKTVDWH